ncbi:MAG: DegQ family serine endoprotease [Gammaproteobacteria bacterium]|nr:DegQ family serine endoprotease [Gammaproteobacteria bacterium]
MKEKNRITFIAAACVLLACAGAGFPLSVSASLPAADSQGRELPSLAPMLDRVLPAVVNISTLSRVPVRDNPLLSDPFFRRFFNLPDRPLERQAQSLGSGVIIDAGQGYVLTNNHVIDKATEIRVTLMDGRQLTARLIGADPEADVAVIQIPAEGLTALPVADSSRLRVGDFVVAIGNPFGLGQTVTSGIVSALGRSGLGIEGFEDFIQTDASINPGNSGGALVNLRGELVGVNTAIIAPGGGNVGIGFAIPTNMASLIMSQLVEYGEVRRGQLGIAAQDLTPELAQAFGVQELVQGVVVVQVGDDTSAARAGIRSGDIVVNINGRDVRTRSELRTAVGLLRIGEKIRIEIVRDGKRRTLTAEIAEPVLEQVTGDELNPRLAGAVFGELDESSPLYGSIEGVVVADIKASSPAQRSGLRPGDIVVAVNRRPVASLEEFRQAVSSGDNRVLLNVQRGQMALFIALQ